MPTIVDKESNARLQRAEFAAIIEMASALSEAEWSKATCLPGWTVKDQLSHMIGTERMLAGDQPPVVELPTLDHVRNDIGRSNEIWVEANRSLPGAEVLAAFREITQRRLAAIDAMTQEDYHKPSWTPAGPNETYGRFMRIRHFDCFMHEQDIRAALGLALREDADHVQSCLDEVATAIGFIVGRRAGFPAGSSAQIELTGAAQAVYLVSVGERAALVPSLEGPATVSLRMPSMTWLRLTGGREAAEAHIGADVVIEGDEELGRKLANNLAFTI
jgi:uncharacterized protein (TIGR03083 family)